MSCSAATLIGIYSLRLKVPLRVQMESLIYGKQGKKEIFKIGFVVCQQFTFKIRRFRFTTAQIEAREWIIGMTSMEELVPTGISRFQLFTRTE